ncbi:MAG: hypothetical protein ACREJP_10720 [Candidatus Methylomirabilales bacterium]
MEPDGEVGSPLRTVVRVVRGVMIVSLGLLLVAGLLWVFASSMTSTPARVLTASVVALLIAWAGIGYFRQLSHPPPPEPEPTEVRSLRLAYVCEMCGLEVAVLKWAKERAPKHCGEEMALVRASVYGRPGPDEKG